MSIFNRLYRIAKANLNRRMNHSGSNSKESDFESEYRRTYSESSGSNRGHGQDTHQSSSQDPELAQYYANLEIPYGSDLETVRKAWKALLKKYHPDLHSTDPEKKKVAQELSQELNHAYQALAKHLKK